MKKEYTAALWCGIFLSMLQSSYDHKRKQADRYPRVFLGLVYPEDEGAGSIGQKSEVP